MNPTVSWKPTTTTTIYSNPSRPEQQSLKIANFNDIHLGHRRTPTIDTIACFDTVLDNEVEVSTWDIIVLTGDLFDSLLYLTNIYLDEIMTFITRLIQLSIKHDIVVRILEGTPAHDHKQSALVLYLNKVIETVNNNNTKADVKHVTELSIEYIEKLNLNVLYVPDEWNLDPLDTYYEALELMKNKSLEQVDICLLHGAFNYQIDAKLNPKSHPEELWSKIVKYYIFSGHVHFPSKWENILVAGSFNRLAHGEEHPKGWLTVELFTTGEHRILFHENKHATIYRTLDVGNKSLESVLELVKEECSTYPKRSHIRLLVTDRDAINDGLKTLRQMYSYFHFTIKVDVKEKQTRTLKIMDTKFEAIQLDPDSVKRLLSERISQIEQVNTTDVIGVLEKYL